VIDSLHVDTVLQKRVYVLVFIEHGTRRMHLGGVTASPTGEWAVQQARNLAFSHGERLENIKFQIRDRGANFTASFDAVFQAAGTRILRTAVQAPRMNAICDRLVGTLRRELLDRVLILGERTSARRPGRVPGAATTRPGRTRAPPSTSRRRTWRSPAPLTDVGTQQIRRKDQGGADSGCSSTARHTARATSGWQMSLWAPEMPAEVAMTVSALRL